MAKEFEGENHRGYVAEVKRVAPITELANEGEPGAAKHLHRSRFGLNGCENEQRYPKGKPYHSRGITAVRT